MVKSDEVKADVAARALRRARNKKKGTEKAIGPAAKTDMLVRGVTKAGVVRKATRNLHRAANKKEATPRSIARAAREDAHATDLWKAETVRKVARNLRRACKKKKMTPEALAHAVNEDVRVIRAILAGKRDLDFQLLKRFSVALRVSWVELAADL
jgi:ribosome-binding protein aMBF1 (putative translation factor)